MQGVGLAPFEALVNASVGDMYCVHERGVRMAVRYVEFCLKLDGDCSVLELDTFSGLKT